MRVKNSFKEIKDWTNFEVMRLLDWMWRNNIYLRENDSVKIEKTSRKMTNAYNVTNEEVDASEDEEFYIQKQINNSITSEIINQNFVYTAKPEDRIEIKDNDSTKRVVAYPRDPQKRINALMRAGFTCEYNPKHESFISKKTNKRYMETHHLIPLEYWKAFKNSLDVEANIVCLCSNCHNEVHYGKYASNIIDSLYKKREKELMDAGVFIDEEDLMKMYGVINRYVTNVETISVDEKSSKENITV